MRKAIREFLIYDAFFAVTMIARYFVVNDIEWGYFWLCVVYFPTVFLFQPVFGLLLGYRAIKKALLWHVFPKKVPASLWFFLRCHTHRYIYRL